MKYLIGNWKANKTTKEAHSWIKQVENLHININKNLQVVLCPSLVHLQLFKNQLPELTLGCQDLSPYGDGAYTGAVTARMLSDLVTYSILGHSERRRYFASSNQKTALKAIQALDNNIIPIVAVDENNWRSQINVLGEKITRKSIIMYEPPEAISQQIGPIGKGETAPLDEVVKMIKQIKEETTTKTCIYGGSIKSRNIREFMEDPIIDGVLPGSASLNADEWIKMVKVANQAAADTK